MYWGIAYYNFMYNKNTGTVSIINIQSSEKRGYECSTYTKEECRLYAKWYRGICPLYGEALKQFPQGELI